MIRTAVIITAIIIAAIIQGYLLNQSKIATESRDHDVIDAQQQIIFTLSNSALTQNKTLTEIDKQVTMNQLFHGALMYLINNNTKSLNTLIAAHNEMIQAIENSTGHHTPIINQHIVNVHNSYCSIYVEKPACKHHK